MYELTKLVNTDVNFISPNTREVVNRKLIIEGWD